MSTYTIEGVGLVEPAGRTASGYGNYDDETLLRLSFIARAGSCGDRCGWSR